MILQHLSRAQASKHQSPITLRSHWSKNKHEFKTSLCCSLLPPESGWSLRIATQVLRRTHTISLLNTTRCNKSKTQNSKFESLCKKTFLSARKFSRWKKNFRHNRSRCPFTKKRWNRRVRRRPLFRQTQKMSGKIPCKRNDSFNSLTGRWRPKTSLYTHSISQYFSLTSLTTSTRSTSKF